MVDNKGSDMRLLPVMPGVPSPLQYTAGASLPPGDYTLKLAVVEGERIGTVEHLIHAGLPAVARPHAQRADGRRPDRGRRAAERRPSAIRSPSARCTATSRPTAAAPTASPSNTRWRRRRTRRRCLNVDVPPHRGQRLARHLHEGHADAPAAARQRTCCARSCRPTARRSRR